MRFQKNNLLLILLLLPQLFNVSFANNAEVVNKKDTLYILFIGNSLTYVNCMPDNLEWLLQNNNYKAKVYQSTHPGFSLFNHVNSNAKYITKDVCESIQPKGKSETVKLLTSRKWDYVIFQDRSLSEDSILFALKFLINQKTSKHYLLYQQYYKKFDFSLEDDIKTELFQIDSASNSIQYQIPELTIIQVNKFFREIVETTNISMYNDVDDPHPGRYTTFLVNALIYKEITKKLPKKYYPGTVNCNYQNNILNKQTLKRILKIIANDSYNK